MSYVSYRTRSLPQIAEPPFSIAENGERRLAERRMARLERWRSEKPLPDHFPPWVPATPPPSPAAPGPAPAPSEKAPSPPLVPIDFKKVSLLAGKDQRVVQRIWETYTALLDSNRFEEAADGRAETQLTLDSRTVAHHLRLDPKEVRKVIESVSTYLSEVFESEKD